MFSKILFRKYSAVQSKSLFNKSTKLPSIKEGKSLINTNHRLLVKNNIEIISDNDKRKKETQDKLDKLFENRLI